MWQAQSPTSNFINSFTENEAAIQVVQGDIRFLISKSTGIITSITKAGKLLVTQGPVFAVIPRNSEDGGKPNVAGETYQNNIYPLKGYPLYTIFASDIKAQQTGDSILVTGTATFSDGSKAHTSYTFVRNQVKVSYEIDYKGSLENPYQYGMLLQLPPYMDRLSWHRKGEFTAYPENDIAREKGSALLNAQPTTGVEPWRVIPRSDWKDDATELGSNDFRSTKKIYTMPN
ncbi:beta-galactosidase small subunit-related protein [Niabella hibiscisoli]|uniref:hypothetical protein n=1 Tax=Niabella hibiscisoli TaxID=1825928 RepID=UPI001F111997|nr:hypothetical protein [Niabella hibiscisoli]MCH5719247.1 hypothetical protein [Niabella hibiscisoli]